MKVLQQDITEPDVFVECLGNILTSLLLDKDTYDFGIYFQNNYNLNYQQWAYCFRKGCGINTNMRLESMHKVIKYFYLEGKKVKRLDRSLHVLLKYLRDKSVDRIIKKTKGKYTQHTSGIIKRHRIAALSYFSIEAIENENKWLIKSKNNVYCIENTAQENCCSLKCIECNICFHMYTCTCDDFVLSHFLCKHIHFVAMKFKTPEVKIDKNNEENELTLPLEEKETTISLRENVSMKMSQTFSKFQTATEDSLDKEVLIQIKSHIDTVDKLLEVKSGSQIFTPFMNNKNNEPSNKKILKQINFFSTKKKKKMKNANIKKPTAKESKAIAINLKTHFNELYVSTSASEDHHYYAMPK